MPEPKLCGSIDEFRQAALESETGDKAPIEARVRASFDTEVKAGEGDARTLTFTISTSSVDRMGDTIKVDGWKLEQYRKNPVVLWAHDATLLPLAKATQVWIEGQKLKSVAEFTPLNMARFNDTVFDMYKGGFLSATSVGFAPLKYAFTDDPQRRYGIDFLEQELLEFSAVPVPANGEALIEGRSAGIDIIPLLDWSEDQIKRSEDVVRILRLADDVLTRRNRDPDLLAWGERILAANGKAIVSRERIEKIERAATAQRLADKRKRELELIEIRGR
jgi:HK97 family phage prohead protease